MNRGKLLQRLHLPEAERMVAAGFTPAQFMRRDCSPYEKTPGAECHDRPEVLQCSGSGKGYCDAYWTDDSRVLSVTPSEGPDGYLADAIAIDAEGFAEGLDEEGNGLTGSAAAAFRRAGAVVRSKPKLTSAWLVETWGPAQYNPDDGGIRRLDAVAALYPVALPLMT